MTRAPVPVVTRLNSASTKLGESFGISMRARFTPRAVCRLHRRDVDVEQYLQVVAHETEWNDQHVLPALARDLLNAFEDVRPQPRRAGPGRTLVGETPRRNSRCLRYRSGALQQFIRIRVALHPLSEWAGCAP